MHSRGLLLEIASGGRDADCFLTFCNILHNCPQVCKRPYPCGATNNMDVACRIYVSAQDDKIAQDNARDGEISPSAILALRFENDELRSDQAPL